MGEQSAAEAAPVLKGPEVGQGLTVLAVGLHCWGKGKSIAEALKQCTKAGGRSGVAQGVLIHVSNDPAIYCEGVMGDVCYSRECWQLCIGDIKGTGAVDIEARKKKAK